MGQPDLPPEWAALVKRFTANVSARGLADLVGNGIAHSTINNLVQGRGRPSQRVVTAVARALNISEKRVRELHGSAPGHGPYEPPENAHLMTPKQREAVNAVIRELVAAGAEAADHVIFDPAIGRNHLKAVSRKRPADVPPQDPPDTD